MDIQSQTQLAKDFLQLHHAKEILVLANVWDVASARLVEQAGFSAIATSSAAVANSLGYPDGERIPREEMLAVVERIAKNVKIPVSADLEAGYGASLADVEATARGMIAAGAVGLNFEDSTSDPANPLFEEAKQVEKIKRIREVAASAGVPIVLNARTDVYLAEVGEPAGRFEHAVRRANAYRKAGADCLFIPGVRDRETIGALVKAIDGPINALAQPGSPTVPELQKLGVARVSFGSWPMRACMGLFVRFAREVKAKGTCESLGGATPYAEMNKLFER
jgi:2-methylisocitrate lyase-like PEP mutase family enzyme